MLDYWINKINNIKHFETLTFFQFNNIDKIVDNFVINIYKNFNYHFNFKKTIKDIVYLIKKNSCINSKIKCNEIEEAIVNNHLICLKYKYE
jgi:hypothetical protein